MTATQHPLKRDSVHSSAALREQHPRDDSQATSFDEEAATPAARESTPWLRILLALAVLYGVFALGVWAAGRSPQPPPAGAFSSTGATSVSPLLVHIAGRVQHPGVYSLPPGARVRDAIQKAGGALRDADINAVNLAAWVEDGTRVEVPRRSVPRQVAAASAPRPIDSQALVGDIKAEIRQAVAAELRDAVAAVRSEAGRTSTAPAAATPAASRARRNARRGPTLNTIPHTTNACGQESTNAAAEYLAKHPINLNTATAEQLQSLPGVGPALAAKILAYRHESKGFKTFDDLDNVSGIGEKKLEKLRPLVTVK